jgi:LysM repeat protein
MTERGLPSVDGSPACPFVAFEDDRDERSTSPDHRHRCYAEEGAPAPRAAAHQEAYCLSSAFPVCPTFQAWARREAARAKHTEPSDRERDQRTMAGLSGADEWTQPPPSPRSQDPDQPIESTPQRNPPRDWAAPPPWAGGAGVAGAGAAAAASRGGGASAEPPGFVGRQPDAAQGLAGSAADRLAGGGSVSSSPSPSSSSSPSSASAAAAAGAAAGDPRPPRPDPGDPDLAALVGRSAVVGRSASSTRDDEYGAAPAEAVDIDGAPPPASSSRRQPVSSTRSDRPRDANRLPPREHVQGPSWERARRNEAYPTIRTRAGLGSLPGLPRWAVLLGALAIAAVALFFLPALFGVGSDGDADPSATPDPTPIPEPTPQTYTIKQGDTLSGIARSFGLTLDELLAANTETIEDPNLIAVGDVIIIPVSDVVEGESAEPTE